jgi:hypothetical protein
VRTIKLTPINRKGSPTIAQRYNELLVPEEHQHLGRELIDLYYNASKLILQVTGHKTLQETNPVLLNSINLRKGYVDPINLIQASPYCPMCTTYFVTFAGGVTVQVAPEQTRGRKRSLGYGCSNPYY